MKNLTITFTTNLTGSLILTDDDQKTIRTANFEVSLNTVNKNRIWVHLQNEICPEAWVEIKIYQPNKPQADIERFLNLQYL
ncbi:hypothetical protein [Mucilaginibacter ginsenosidivorax]|uniref:Uncharacterized protein n=1 Tax=Mucilaginibacter ginsenosidivorax TaxID=862126 RepID=A0A5B8W746_9SPHI|nr:hypothetical protein [Mucilaginibacter ginsenosidivorax]QEC78755.1 hypothetical protein FSB76_23425 [Mucilaginibacter ginsenosidivorax]